MTVPFNEIIESSSKTLRWGVSIRGFNLRWRRPNNSLLTSSYAAAELVQDIAVSAAWRRRGFSYCTHSNVAAELVRDTAAAAPRRRRRHGGGGPPAEFPPVYFQNNAFREVIDSSRRKLHWSVSIRVLNFRWGHPKPSLLTSSNDAADLVADAAARLRGGGGAILVFLKATLRRSWFGKLPRRRRGGRRGSGVAGAGDFCFT